MKKLLVLFLSGMLLASCVPQIEEAKIRKGQLNKANDKMNEIKANNNQRLEEIDAIK